MPTGEWIRFSFCTPSKWTSLASKLLQERKWIQTFFFPLHFRIFTFPYFTWFKIKCLRHYFSFLKSKVNVTFRKGHGMPGGAAGVTGPRLLSAWLKGLSEFSSPKEPLALARRGRRLQRESHAAAFLLTSNPGGWKLIPHKDSPPLWSLFEIRQR